MKKLALLWTLCAASLTAQAAPPDNRSGCDIRQLNLDSTQRGKLQERRRQYKDELRQINREEERRRSDGTWRGLFDKSSFDRQQAHKIAQERHAEDVRRTVAELSFYHDLFQMLNSRQQQMWTEKCGGSRF